MIARNNFVLLVFDIFPLPFQQVLVFLLSALQEAIQVLAKHCESLRSLEVNHSSENARSPSGDSRYGV